jgi:hypothetical protein
VIALELIILKSGKFAPYGANFGTAGVLIISKITKEPLLKFKAASQF